MASEEKIGVASPYVIMPLDNVSRSVLPSTSASVFQQQMQDVGLEVYVADVTG